MSACTPSMPTLPDLPSMPDIIPDLSLPVLYKDDIQQGSILDRFKINQLKTGMSQAQVQNLIGSPSIIDPFHNDQWNYINHSTLHEQDDIHYRLVLSFNNGKLTKIDTSGINSLPSLTDKEKALEGKRLADEKLAIELAKQEKIKAQKLADEKAKAVATAAIEKRLADEKLAIEKAQAEALKKKTDLAQAKQKKIDQEQLDQQKIIDKENLKKATDKTIKDTDRPWYKFW